jgi:hypothetical protein
MNLTEEILIEEASRFATSVSQHSFSELYGCTDGKRVSTFFEKRFQSVLSRFYDFQLGNAAKGIDFPSLNVDMKFTSHEHPQSSSPFLNHRQRVFGLGYSLLVFVYCRSENHTDRSSCFNIESCSYLCATETGDARITAKIIDILSGGGNKKHIEQMLLSFDFPQSDATEIADSVMQHKVVQGKITISLAMQYRLTFGTSPKSKPFPFAAIL